MADLNLGNGVGLIRKVLQPLKRFILWAKTDSVTAPNYFEIHYPTGVSDWELLFKDGFDKETYLWSSTVTYNNSTNRFAFYNFTMWRSLTNGNVNNPPSEGSNWTEEAIRTGTHIPQHQAGLYGDGVIVISHPTTNMLYYLDAATRPYASSNLDNEIMAGDWIQVGTTSSSSDPVTESAAASLVLNTPGTYIYTGSINASWTLKALSTPGNVFRIKNGSATGTVILNGNGAEQIFDSQDRDSITIFQGGQTEILVEGNTKWYK